MNELFTQIENPILEALMCSNLSAAEIKVVLALLRKTNGFHKDSDQISQSQLVKMTGLSKQSVVNSLSQIRLVNIIRLVKKGNSRKASNEWAFNKNVATWQLVKRSVLVKFPVKELVKLTRHTKERIQNKYLEEEINKGSRSKGLSSEENVVAPPRRAVFEAEAEQVLATFNKATGKKSKGFISWIANYIKWREVFSLEEITKAIENIPSHRWFRSNKDVQTLTIFFRTNQSWIEQCLAIEDVQKNNDTPDFNY